MLPRTARDLGVDADSLSDPETGIAAGIAYLGWTRQRFPDLPVGEQILFALGAYNAGHGHIRDGRRLARELGLDGSIWFDNVERAMLKLAEPEYARKAVYGYVRGDEVVRYVRDIQDRYRLYVRHFRLLEQDATDEVARSDRASFMDDERGRAGAFSRGALPEPNSVQP